MATILLTYDVKKTSDTIHQELKQYLINNYQFATRILASNGNWYTLPNTCLIKNNIDTQTASQQFVTACVAVGAHWEKYIAVDYGIATFNNQQ